MTTFKNITNEILIKSIVGLIKDCDNMPVRFWYTAHIAYDLIKLDIH